MLEEEVAILNRKMDRVLGILENDDSTSKPGLVADVIDLRNKFVSFVEVYDKGKNEKAGADKVWKIVYGTIGAFILSVLKTIGTAIAAIFTHT